MYTNDTKYTNIALRRSIYKAGAFVLLVSFV